MNQKEWNIPALLQMTGAYWGACALHAAVKLDVFSPLSENSLDARTLSDKIKADARSLTMLLDSLTALGLLTKLGHEYSATDFSAAYLNKDAPGYMGHIIMHHHHLVDGWGRLHEAVLTGKPVRKGIAHDDSEAVRESFLMGMFNLASLMAPRIAPHLSLENCRKLIDLGGGPGTYAIHFCKAYPELYATVYDLSTTRRFAEQTIKGFGLEERINFVAGDYLVDALPDGYDAAWLSHVLHADGPESCQTLLDKAVAALVPGGRLFIQEFILNDEKTGPEFPALFSLNMLIGTENGQAYSQSELAGMMVVAGLTDIELIELDLPNGAGILVGRKR